MEVENSTNKNLTKEELLFLLKRQNDTINSLEHDVRKCKNLFKNSLDGIYKSTPDGQYINVNSALVKMLGYDSKEELLAVDIKTELYYNYKDRNEVVEHFADSEKKRHRLYKKDKSIIWVENYGENIKNKEGEVLYYEGILRDVTEIKRASDIQKVLLNISQHGYKHNDLKEYNKYIINELGKLIDVSNSYIAYYNEDRQTISIPFISGEETEEEIPTAHTLTGYLIKKKKSLFLNSKQLQILDDAGEIKLVGANSKIWLGVPLIIDDVVIGAIVVQSYDNEKAFKQRDLDLLEFVSSYISSAMLRSKKSFELRKFSLAVEQSANTIVITNAQGEIEYVNAKFTETSGYSKEEAIGNNPRILNSGNQEAKYYSGMWETISSGQEWMGEFQNKSKNGKLYWERAAITSIKDSDGVITNYLAIKEDITLKKKKDEELAISKEVLRKVLDNIPVKVFWKDKESKFLGCNSAFLKDNLFKNNEEIIGKSDFEFNNRKDAESYRNDDVAIMLSGKSKLNFQHSNIRNGKKRWVTTSKLPFYDENNNVIGIIGTSEDITERIEKEEELALSKELLRKVLDNIPIRVYWKDADSKFLGCNKEYLKEMGIDSEDDVIGKTDLDVHTKENAEIFRADEVEMMQSGKAKLKYKELVHTFGKERWVLTSKVPFFNDDNEIVGTLGTSEDITKRLEDEQKLKTATENAISANLSKSVFLSNMSHEIRTPMNAILGYSQLLQDDDNLTKVQQDNLKTINKSGEHLLALINDILDMSKIEAGRITLKKADFNFIELLKEVEGLFKFKSAQKGLVLSMAHVNKIPLNLFADESKVRQVIINLIGNAIKFTPEGFVDVSIESLDNNYIKVSVKDSGIGILKEEQESVFKPFEQAQKGERVSGGTGLGLAISKKFSKLMDGDITIESEYGKGSTFTFIFKYKESQESTVKDVTEELKIVGLVPEMIGMKLAIVDDRFENRDILYKKLEPLGFDIRMAENGKEAVELYKEWRPEIMLMDVVMPVMNGVEATRQILKTSGSHKVKIFVVSASALESEQKEVMEIGATVFIKKPVIFKILLSEMHVKGGVNFVYKDVSKLETATVEPSDVPVLVKDKLLVAASEGDFTLLLDILEELENETGKTFKYLEECVNEMEFEELINWFNS